MKVISGILKGRKIDINNKLDFRPSLSRIREDIFNLLIHNSSMDHMIQKSIFADIFCGSGSIGIEALSRGYKHCHFNDINSDQIELISKFFKKTVGLSYDITNEDIANTNNKVPWENFDILYYDPPYNIEIEPIILKNIIKVKDEAIVITETNYKIFNKVDSIYLKKYKNKYIGFYKSNKIKKMLNV